MKRLGVDGDAGRSEEGENVDEDMGEGKEKVRGEKRKRSDAGDEEGEEERAAGTAVAVEDEAEAEAAVEMMAGGEDIGEKRREENDWGWMNEGKRRELMDVLYGL